MPTTTTLPVQQLKLDLRNFRTVPQPNEPSAINALVSINAEWFWALTESLIDDGYHPTENILVSMGGKKATEYEVKEGNRRVAALKLIFGYAKREKLFVPAHIDEKIVKLSDNWRTTNALIPCAVYQKGEEEVVDRIVTLTHGKGEQAGRDRWGTVPRARHNRDKNMASEPALDLLEKYLKHGQNVAPYQRERWAGEYNLTVLGEALQRLAPRVGEKSARDLVANYPKVKFRQPMEKIFHDIGSGMLGFERIRSADFAVDDGIPAPAATASAGSSTSSSSSTAGASNSAGSNSKSSKAAKSGKTFALPLDDPRAVSRTLRKFRPVGNNRDKLVTLLDEARRLNAGKYPHAFCFLLRSMFEISAKAYCQDHKKLGGPSATKPSGEERKMVEILRDVTKHLTKNNTDKAMVKALHGAMTELGTSNGFLSVTSMNQLIHNPSFIVDGRHISTVFANVFPLLEAMNS